MNNLVVSKGSTNYDYKLVFLKFNLNIRNIKMAKKDC